MAFTKQRFCHWFNPPLKDIRVGVPLPAEEEPGVAFMVSQIRDAFGVVLEGPLDYVRGRYALRVAALTVVSA